MISEERICQGFSQWTGQPCGAKAVRENTVKKGTREFLDPKFCQMHQPGRISKKKCICPHCAYHRSRDSKSNVTLNEEEEDENIDESLFGSRKTKQKQRKKTLKKKNKLQ